MIDRTVTSPFQLNQNGQVMPNLAYTSRIHQDWLMFHVIFVSLSLFTMVMSLVASTLTSCEAWQKLTRLYANCSISQIMYLKDKLSFLTMGNKFVFKHLQAIKCNSMSLHWLILQFFYDDLIIYALKSLGIDYKEIVANVRTCENMIIFKELHHKFVKHEMFLRHLDFQIAALFITKFSYKFTLNHHCNRN